ncbi:hypothetical protein VNO77_03869 [Canavalia gladiata]|uniref:Uncharacterized protein n=1 Tax=Canavalia gladiata TaxID=3824 RepID=A0AAN9MVH0_CANGL
MLHQPPPTPLHDRVLAISASLRIQIDISKAKRTVPTDPGSQFARTMRPWLILLCFSVLDPSRYMQSSLEACSAFDKFPFAYL